MHSLVGRVLAGIGGMQGTIKQILSLCCRYVYTQRGISDVYYINRGL